MPAKPSRGARHARQANPNNIIKNKFAQKMKEIANNAVFLLFHLRAIMGSGSVADVLYFCKLIVPTRFPLSRSTTLEEQGAFVPEGFGAKKSRAAKDVGTTVGQAN